MNKDIFGVHHVTAIAGDPNRNMAFYAEILGLKLVKLTVNFDDPGSYHFYYGDEIGHPGTLLTFFFGRTLRAGAEAPGKPRQSRSRYLSDRCHFGWIGCAVTR